MIRDLLDISSKLNLFTSLRHFGKTLPLSMLKMYFEQEIMENGYSLIILIISRK